MNVDRSELIEELDLALAALRRVIMRAIDAGTQSEPRAAKIEQKPPKAAPPIALARPAVKAVRKPSRPARDDFVRNDIAVCFDPPSVKFAKNSVEVSYRQAELVAVLAGAMTVGWLDRKIAAEKAWPDLAVASAAATISEAIHPLTERLASIGLRFTSERGFGLRLSVAERAAS